MTAAEFKKMMMDVLTNTSLDETCEFLGVIEEIGNVYSQTQTSILENQFRQMCSEVLELIDGGKFPDIETIPNENDSIVEYRTDDETSMSNIVEFILESKRYSFELSCLIPWGWYSLAYEYCIHIYAEDEDYISGLENMHNAIATQFPSHVYKESDGYIEIPCTKGNFSSNALDVLTILNNLSK